MTDKEKIVTNLKKALDSLDITSNLRLVLIQTIEYLQEEPVSENLEEAAKDYSNNLDNICGSVGEQTRNAFKAGAKWQKTKDQKK